MIKCEGDCGEDHEGKVCRVNVSNKDHDWGEFDYCEEAIRSDEKFGFTVEVLEPVAA